MIQNPGFSPPECYTILGVSTSRTSGVQGVIGQFGSGSKHAVNLLLRNDIKPIIFTSQLRLEFYAEQQNINDGLGSTAFGQVYCRQTGRLDGNQINRTKDLGFVLEHGVHDWTDLAMGLREFVANAIDRTIRQENGFREALSEGRLAVRIVEDKSVRAKEGFTRIFIPVTPEIQRFYGELPRRFLHFSEPDSLNRKILLKNGRNLSNSQVAMIYKHGVFVREIKDCLFQSLFDYNFGDELRLDESRNVDDYTVRTSATHLLRDADEITLSKVFSSLAGLDQTWESTFNKYDLSPGWEKPEKKETRKKTWQAAWARSQGSKILCGTGLMETQMVSGKGFDPVTIAATSWVEAATEQEIANANQIMTRFELEGRDIMPPTNDAVQAVDAMWNLLTTYKFTFNKEKPTVKCFRDKMEGGTRTLGFYENNVVYINEQHASDGQNKMLLKTALEELTHYITGATDMSRDFQDFLLRLIIEQNV